MSSNSIERGVGRARTISAWSSVTLASILLAACGGGGGGDDDSGGQTSPPPPPPPPPAPANVAPTVNAGAAFAVDLPTDNANLAGSATDDSLPAGSSLTYTWEVVNGPLAPGGGPGVKFASNSSAATNARFVGGPGDYVLRLNASDSALTGSGTVNVTVRANTLRYPDPILPAGVHGWATATPAEENMNVAKLDEARDYSIANAQNIAEAGIIIRNGRLVYQWGDITRRHELKSTTKSVGGLAFLLALDEGQLALSDKASAKLPVFGTDPAVDTTPVTSGGLADISLLQLATHTAGFSKPDNNLQLLYSPGTTWSYSDQGLNWLADVLTQTYAQDLSSLLFDRVYTRLGIRPNDLRWRDNAFRSHTLSVNGVPQPRRELASGIDANVNAMARVGYLMLRKGVWQDSLVLSNDIVTKARTVQPEIGSATNPNTTDFPGATSNYGILWWTNTSGQMSGVPTDAFWAWGLHDTLIIVVPSLDLVIARAGDRGWRVQDEFWNADYAALAPFLTPIVQSITP